MTKIERQKSNIEHLLELIKENPDLEIVPFVVNEVCAGDDFYRWLGGWGEAKVDYMYCPDWNDKENILDPERAYLHSLDEEYIKDVMFDHFVEEKPAWSLTYIEEIVDDEYQNVLDWEKVIVVDIDLP